MPGFAATLEKLAGHDPWMQARFFLGRSKHLGDARPHDELRRGSVESVLRAAEEYGEQGAA